MTVVRFPQRPPGSAPARFTRPTPLFDDDGRQTGVAAPGSKCDLMAVYDWNPGAGSPRRERAKVYYRGRVYDVDRGAVLVEAVEL